MGKEYDAICTTCHKACKVPFFPSGKSPITCKECWSASKQTIPSTTIKDAPLMSMRDNSIVAQVILKAAVELRICELNNKVEEAKLKTLADHAEQLADLYKYTTEKLL